MAVSIEEYKKSVKRLEDALAQPKNEFTRDSVIQRFEFTIELAWKTSRKIMGTTTTAPKQVIREMAQAGLINEIDLWLRAIDVRNLSSHTYNENIADQVYDFVKGFFPYAQGLLKKLNHE